MRAIPHDEGRHVAMPLGGIGTGNVAICADGALRQWQLHNIGNHKGDLPNSFFALRVARVEPPCNEVRVLQAPPASDPSATRTPLVSDDFVPTWQRDLLDAFPGVQATTFRGLYPFAEVEYHDEALPVRIALEAFTPMVPLDVERSSIPAALFTFTVTNFGSIPLHGWLGAAVQNPVGGDGVINPVGEKHPGYGGNVNRVERAGGWTSLVMESVSTPPEAPGAGQFVLSVDGSPTTVFPQWTDARQFMAFLRSRQPFGAHDWDHMPANAAEFQTSGIWPRSNPSPAGSTWNGGMAAQFTLGALASTKVRFVMAWHFPNRYVNFTQFGGVRPEWGSGRFFLGNHYTTQYRDAIAVAERVQTGWAELESDSRAWTHTLTASVLSDVGAEHLAAQAAIVRSPSFFRAADGDFFGFEGVLGESTTMWAGDLGGSCPLNCTHVFAYAQGLAKLFPELERSMRECEFDVMQAPEGYIPHRVIVPTYLPQIWDRPIHGPEQPALDGMLSTVLKTYRQVRIDGDLAWLERYWPNLERLLTYVAAKWDPDGSGLLHGIQPSTHDIDLAGINPFMGTMWLAALRAGEEMARLIRADKPASQWREWFELGRAAYDEALFNDEYYIQVLEEGDPEPFQWKTGCLADQLIGQWWAHTLDLGYLLPKEHVHSALRAVVRHNLRHGFSDFEHEYRVFADRDDTGLLMCTWPRGGRPEVPTRYCDEVWTGSEYQVAGHCLMEGLIEEGESILAGLWARYDGRRRNPYNQIECGDHYVRALAGWSVFEAYTGSELHG